MFAKFNKIAVASAVAAALGGSGAAQAVNLGQPGSALLIPHVKADAKNQENTVIGVIVGDNVTGSVNNVQANQDPPAPWFTYSTFNAPVGDTGGCGAQNAGASGRATLHWYFFDENSVEKRNGTIPVTCNDFVRLDWNFLTTGTALQGVAGYMLISDNRATSGTAPSQLALWGHSYFIRGNWATQAFIPVVPLHDVADSNPTDEVTYSGGFPSNVNPFRAGMALADIGNDTQVAQFSLRYFNDPVLNGNTKFVIWLPNTDGNRDAVGTLVYDADEAAVSTTLDLSKELNVIDSLIDDNLKGVTLNNPCVTSAFGAPHAIIDLANPAPPLPAGCTTISAAQDSGFVLVSLKDGAGASVGEFGTATGRRGGVAFSLVGIGAAAAGLQLQTEMAHERGLNPASTIPALPAP